jgi:hypothetical protein
MLSMIGVEVSKMAARLVPPTFFSKLSSSEIRFEIVHWNKVRFEIVH